MIELYFLIYRIPKMMSSLAREHNRSPVAWSLIGIAAWIGAEIIVFVGIGIVYGIGAVLWGWPEELPAGLRFGSYVVALAAAIGGLTIARRILSSKSDVVELPPPPPQFR